MFSVHRRCPGLEPEPAGGSRRASSCLPWALHSRSGRCQHSRLTCRLRPGPSEPPVGGPSRPGNKHTLARAPGGLRCFALRGDRRPGRSPWAQGECRREGQHSNLPPRGEEGRADAPVRCVDTSFSQGSSRAKLASRELDFVIRSIAHSDKMTHFWVECTFTFKLPPSPVRHSLPTVRARSLITTR